MHRIPIKITPVFWGEGSTNCLQHTWGKKKTGSSERENTGRYLRTFENMRTYTYQISNILYNTKVN